MVSPIVSQSLPPPTLDEHVSYNFRLADFSNGPFDELWHFLFLIAYVSTAQFVSDQTTDDITPLGLRPPEVVLGGEWNESVDVWTYGCMVSSFLVNVYTYLAAAFVRFSRCLPVAHYLNLCHRRRIMLQKSMFYFIKWSCSAASFSQPTSFGGADVAWIIFN